MIEIRAVGADDWATWRDLRLAALATAPDAFGSTLADWCDADEARWRRRLSGAGHRNLVALLDGEPVGMASGVPGGSETVELISMYVAPAVRGCGVADRLVAEVVAHARMIGARRIRLDVRRGNRPAIAAYRRNGFAFVDHPPGDPAERTMQRPIDPPSHAR